MPRPLTQDDAANLARRQAEAGNKILKRGIEKSMQVNPACIMHLDQHLRALGLHAEQTILGCGGSGAVAPSRGTAAASAKAAAKKLEAVETKQNGEMGMRNYKVERMSILMLKKTALNNCAPIGLSTPNVTAWLKHFEADEAKEEALRAYEFCTGRTRSFALTGDLRQEVNFSQDCKARSEARGFRGNTLRLPVDWPKDGLYSIAKYTQDQYFFVVTEIRGPAQASCSEFPFLVSRVPQDELGLRGYVRSGGRGVVRSEGMCVSCWVPFLSFQGSVFRMNAGAEGICVEGGGTAWFDLPAS